MGLGFCVPDSQRHVVHTNPLIYYATTDNLEYYGSYRHTLLTYIYMACLIVWGPSHHKNKMVF